MLGKLTLPDHPPVFLNEGISHAQMDLMKMEAMQRVVSKEDRPRLERDIKLTRAGVKGEQRVIYELLNSHYPLVFIHDLCLEYDGRSAQIDFLVITPYHYFVVECKNLVGDIVVDASGSFVRSYREGRYLRREGIYSPVEQNRRHMDLLKEVMCSEGSAFKRFARRLFVDDWFRSVVVLANERGVMDVGDAPLEVQGQVMRLERLVRHIRDLDAKASKREFVLTFKEMLGMGRRWLALNAPKASDLGVRYALDAAPEAEPVLVVVPEEEPEAQGGEAQTDADEGAGEPTHVDEVPTCPICGAPMVLRTARRGKYQGNRFWGCSTYGRTRCRGTRKVSPESQG